MEKKVKCKHCDKFCVKHGMITHEKFCVHNPLNYKECKHCNKQIFNKGTFCNNKCTGFYFNNISKANTKEAIEMRPKLKKEYKKCKNCRKYFNCMQIKIQKFCSQVCSQEYRQIKRIHLLEVHGVKYFNVTPRQEDVILKNYLIWRNGEKCSVCGWNETNKFTNKIPIELDHVDGNPHNQSLTNVRLVCPNCHSLSEFCGSRGKGRKWRKTVINYEYANNKCRKNKC